MGAQPIEPVTLEIDDVTIKFRGQWVDSEAADPQPADQRDREDS